MAAKQKRSIQFEVAVSPISQWDFEAALRNVTPGVSQREREPYGKLTERTARPFNPRLAPQREEGPEASGPGTVPAA
jgi:hypothetical protein